MGGILRGYDSAAGGSKKELYAWVQRALVQGEYARQGRQARGVVRAYLCKTTGKSMPQITRLIRQYRQTGEVRAVAYRRRRFAQVYTEADVRLLAQVDRAHERLSGPATRRILAREYQDYGRTEYARLAGISPAHLYNLRKRPDYRKVAAYQESIRAAAHGVSFGLAKTVFNDVLRSNASMIGKTMARSGLSSSAWRRVTLCCM